MRTAPAPVTPSLAPLRAVSHVIDSVGGELDSLQRDLVLVERIGRLTLAVGAVALAGVVVVLVARRLGRGPTAHGPGAPVDPAPGWATDPTTERPTDAADDAALDPAGVPADGRPSRR